RPFVGAAVAAHIQAPPPDSEVPAGALGELFDLPPAIARFAWALARTGGIAESAEQLGLSIETARFYSKTLYAKLGVKGQAELARPGAHQGGGPGLGFYWPGAASAAAISDFSHMVSLRLEPPLAASSACSASCFTASAARLAGSAPSATSSRWTASSGWPWAS